MKHDLYVATFVVATVLVDRICVNCPIVIADHVLLVDLHAMGIKGYDIILRIDGLSTSHAVVDCQAKRVYFKILGEVKFIFYGSDSISPPRIVSA